METTGGESARPVLRVYFGDVDVGPAVTSIRTKNAINELASAKFDLDLVVAGGAHIDYLGEVRITAEVKGEEHPLFTGSVIEANPQEGSIKVRCGSGVALQETLVPAIASHVPGVEMIYLTLRHVGFPDERMRLDGLDELRVEPFEVIAPLVGVEVHDEVVVGAVRLVSAISGELTIASLELADSLRDRFLGATGYAVAYEAAARTALAEEQGLRSIDVTLGWLTVRARYGLARLPDGSALRFNRTRARTRVERGDSVFVRGMNTSRWWLRAIASNREDVVIDLSETDLLSPSLPGPLSMQDQQAILAGLHAAAEADPLGRVTALWEAIEFYVAQTTLPKMFTTAEMKEIKASLPGTLTEGQRRRASDRLAELNSPPLLARLRAALAEDGVSVTAGEMALLQRLRRLRNDAVHGRAVELPRPDELEYATSVVYRMLVHRMARLSK